jgi:hypothetical protein
MSKDAMQLRNHLDLTQYAGFPIFFFDFGFLLANVPNIAGWAKDKLETVIGARADNMLTRADVRVPVGNGFYIIFSSRELNLAQERANAICTDVLKHFFGTDSLIPEGANAFCRPSTLQAVASDLGTTVPIPAANATHAAAEGHEQGKHGNGAENPPSLMDEMNMLFRRHFGEERHEQQKFVFAPIWDSAQERIASFFCEPTQPVGGRGPGSDKSSTDTIAAQCSADIAALAFGLKGIWHIVSRGDIALITVPVHIETLSWSKHRNAYLNELAHIEPRLLGLLAFRIHGLDAGSSLSQLSQGVSVLRRHARRIFVHLPSVSLDFSHAGILGVTGLGVSAPAHSPRMGEGPLDQLAAVATRLKRICAGQNALAYLDNVQSPAAVALLKSQGVRLIAGHVLDAPGEEPGPVKGLTLSAILDSATRTGNTVVVI